MKDRGPDGNPGHKLRVQSHIVSLYDVEDGVIEQGYQPCDADNSQGLCARGAENDARQGGREKCFIDAVEAASVAVHVQDEC